MKYHFLEQESCLVGQLGLKEAQTLFEREATWTAHGGMHRIHHQQSYADHRHRCAAKGCSWVMIHSTSFAVLGLSHVLDHSCCCLSMHLNLALLKSVPYDAQFSLNFR